MTQVKALRIKVYLGCLGLGVLDLGFGCLELRAVGGGGFRALGIIFGFYVRIFLSQTYKGRPKKIEREQTMERLDKFAGKLPLNRTSNLTWDPLTRTVVCKWLLSASTSIRGRLAKRVWSLAMDAGKGCSHRKETPKMVPFFVGTALLAQDVLTTM